eukprot:4531022-Pyramimonas_sp.AAC.1
MSMLLKGGMNMFVFASKCVSCDQSLVRACRECVPRVLSNKHERPAAAGMNASVRPRRWVELGSILNESYPKMQTPRVVETMK